MPTNTDVPRIRTLPKTLANQIAAGEVIERPASVVKELLENAFDAGCSRVEIVLKDGGCRLIQVSDDGHGIHPDDMDLALQRHSTSKLRSQSDLDCISSLGFRGEALASIASVSRFTLASRPAGADMAWSLQIDPVSGDHSLKPVGHPAGTTVTVADIFQAVPARKKFMRSERTEFLHVHETVKRLAMSRFGVALRLINNDRMVLNCGISADDPEGRVREIFGKGFSSAARKFDNEDDGTRFWGWVGQPDFNRSQSNLQYTYINGRLIRDRWLSRTIRSAWDERVPTGRYPAWLVFLEIDPARVDVNVHPAKSEVRFRNSRDILNFIHSCVRTCLGTGNNGAVPMAEAGAQVHEQTVPPYPGVPGHSRTYPGRQGKGDNETAGLGRVQMVVAGQFAITLRQNSHILVNGRNLRELFLQQRLLEQLQTGTITSRPLLVPVNLKPGDPVLKIISEHQALLEKSGLSTRLVAADTVQVKTIPVLLEQCDIHTLLTSVATSLLEAGNTAVNPEDLVAVLAGTATDGSMFAPSDMQDWLCWLDTQGYDTARAAQRGLWRTLDEDELMDWLDG